jgi:prepilin-type N-terminal cleavage/methylation domain-containing protein
MKNIRTAGFTIVELLIVIVVIGILAAITIVAYNGIQDRARASSVSSALSQAAKKLAVFQVDNPDIYPADKTALEALGIKDLSSISYQNTRTSSTPNTYCLTATTGATSYKVSNTNTTPQAGGCAGHGVGGVAAITNLVTNPSFESGSATNYSSYNSAPLSVISSGCYSGTRCASVDTSAGANRGIIYLVPTATTAGASYVYSAYVKGTPGQTVVISARPTDNVGAYLGEGAGGVTYTLSSTWQRISSQPVVLIPAATRPGFQIRANTGDPTPFNVDAAMITEGTSLSAYADGASTDWVWNGTVNNSTSTGPAL